MAVATRVKKGAVLFKKGAVLLKKAQHLLTKSTAPFWRGLRRTMNDEL
jgi:hypothetical protein